MSASPRAEITGKSQVKAKIPFKSMAFLCAACLLSGCAAAAVAVPIAIQTAPIWVPAVETAIGAGVTLGVEIVHEHHGGNAPDPASRP